VAINADSAADFANNITAQIGNPHTTGAFTPDIQFTTKGKDVPDKITSIGLTVATAITKVRFGMGRPDAKNRAATDEMVTAIADHEGKHRQIFEATAAAALTAAQRFVGTGNTTAANKALTTDLKCAANKQHEALDAQEGLLSVDAGLKVTKKASGAKYPCPAAAASGPKKP